MARDQQTALLFPGQGSQTSDMRENVERSRPDLLELALAEVGDDLFERAADGTRWAQPAIYCAALAGHAELDVRADAMAGHSLGEITALVAAGSLGAEDGLRLVAARGRLMQEAAEETGDGGMTAVRAREGNRETIAEVAANAGVAIANDNAPDQLVLSGALDALDRAEAELQERGIRGKRLPVAGAFHSPLMRPAVEPFTAIVESVEFAEPRVPVMSCVTAQPFDDIPRELVRAITEPVRWLGVVRALEERGVTDFVETGPGRVLTNLVKKSLVMEAAGA
ncbi:MAG TPA: ACP S-malonyltransferase [Thermoleophilaceae bacterium]|nr:ACP S-malonyltransferase [Thermoleophilaceae bacterium]